VGSQWRLLKSHQWRNQWRLAAGQWLRRIVTIMASNVKQSGVSGMCNNNNGQLSCNGHAMANVANMKA